jgi:hypothetical protein
MRLHAIPDPRIDTVRDTDPDARLDDTVPQTFVGGPLLDVDELEDTQPSLMAPNLEEDFFDAPTQPDLRFNVEPRVDDHHWERVLHAVSEAVRRVFASTPT